MVLCVEIKCQLDATEVFIADLIACSTCFGHHYAHHQELKSIIRVVAWCFGFQVAGLVWSCGLCVMFAGCCSILQTSILFPHIHSFLRVYERLLWFHFPVVLSVVAYSSLRTCHLLCGCTLVGLSPLIFISSNTLNASSCLLCMSDRKQLTYRSKSVSISIFCAMNLLRKWIMSFVTCV